ncbi:hypothetical protein V3C99_018548 [Haemonchus contortus]
MDFLGSPSAPQLSQSSSTDELVAQSTAEPSVLEKSARPSLSYKDLIIEAIESSPDKRLKAFLDCRARAKRSTNIAQT